MTVSDQHRNPPTAVDIIIELYSNLSQESDLGLLARRSFAEMTGIVLIKRGHPPFEGKWALPGGFQEWGESLEATAIREAREETGLDIELIAQLQVYSEPCRDPRGPVNSVGYVAKAVGVPCGGDDAAAAKVFSLDQLPPLAFDHAKRIQEYVVWKNQMASKSYKAVRCY